MRSPASTGRECFMYCGKHFLRRFSQRHNSFFIALAAHQHITEVEFQVFELDGNNLRDAKRSSVEHFQHGAIAQGNRFALLSLRSLISGHAA